MDSSSKQQSNKGNRKRSGRKNRKKMQPDPKLPGGACDGAGSACSRKNSATMRPGEADVPAGPGNTTSHLQFDTKELLHAPETDPTPASNVEQITGPVTAKNGRPAKPSGPAVHGASTEATTELPPCRPLHSCPTPWRPGEKRAPVQLKNSANSNETHHRTILAILNRITDTKMELLLSRSVSLILPLHSSSTSLPQYSVVKDQPKGSTLPSSSKDQPKGSTLPSSSKDQPKGSALASSSNRNSGCSSKVVDTTQEKSCKFVPDNKVSESANKNDEKAGSTASGDLMKKEWNIQKVRKDFVSMLLEKAQEEEMYTREYSWFLRGLCAAIEVEADCAQLALERVQERWGYTWSDFIHLRTEPGKAVHQVKTLEKERFSGVKSTVMDSEDTESRRSEDVGAEALDQIDGMIEKSKNSRRGKRKGTSVKKAGIEEKCLGQLSSDLEESNCLTTHQTSQGIEISRNVCDIIGDNTLGTCIGNSNDERSCDTSSFNEITVLSDAELDAFLRNSSSSNKGENQQTSCGGAYGNLSRFRTVIRHRALYHELFTQGPSFRELVSTETLLRFNVLYGSLRQLYAGTTPWDEYEERHLRRRLKNHLRLMVMLHLSTLLPLATLELVRNTLAGPLEHPAAAAPFAGGLPWGALNLHQAGGMIPPPQNALEQVVNGNGVFNPVDGLDQLPQEDQPGAEEEPPQQNEPLVAGILFEQAAAADNMNAANNNLIHVVNDPNNGNPNHVDNPNNGNVNDNPNNGNLNNVNIINNNVNNANNINNVINNVNNQNNMNNALTNGATLLGMSAELLSFYLTTAGHINLRDRARTDEVCDLLQQILPHLSSRQTFLVVTVLELQQRGWTEVKAPDRRG